MKKSDFNINITSPNINLSLDENDIKTLDNILKELVKRENDSNQQLELLTNTSMKYLRRINEDELVNFQFDKDYKLINPEITKKGYDFIKFGGYSKLSSNGRLNLKKIFYDPWTIAILGGLIVGYILLQISIKKENTNINSYKLIKPLIRVEPYRVTTKMDSFTNIDSLKIEFTYQGTKSIINENFRIVNYEFYDKPYILKEAQGFDMKPKINLLETFITNPIIDSVNTKESVILQIKRKMLLSGSRIAYFEKEDKEILGVIKISFDYMFNDSVVKDSISTNIYFEKE
ncbi:hypothetical protein BW723_14560 [Polaribacter reichenbachii]|uniref:Uncharacterized protein n=1 Tax=Polaribacter reichenbachii TaxID=996801 RepID=A0A1B8U4B6_9FLAO|nr:hypothetical protein [Polaribacter reichenbachii]APZ47432.1 hypothetical protein BW723_14560 [Polaribacter reichenbachii]AUC18070.1 hypothetical protein BTO17_05000 [Polaribacter reichenbachii]OBY66681.1 hypothetical protein LPB301_05630 [Polaribacter reichenbachii]